MLGVSMRDDLAISAQNLGKHYSLYRHPSDRLLNAFFPRFRAPTEKWALRNVSFDIRKGETFGIVGRNGSGKSTLLQIICGIIEQDEGDISVAGRVAALLELGAGFNPMFTGRDNIFVNGAIMGFTRREMETRYDDIVRFANIGPYIDQPVRTYSSGMQARLGFAVAINVDPDILVVDEALAVGDAAFQRRCFARIEEIRDSGATVLFVSHESGTVADLCQRAMFLHNGELLSLGDSKTIVAQYQKLVYAPEEHRESVIDGLRKGEDIDEIIEENWRGKTPAETPFSYKEFVENGARIVGFHIENDAGEHVHELLQYEVYTACFEVLFTAAAKDVFYELMIKTVGGIEIGGLILRHGEHIGGDSAVEDGESYQMRLPFKASMNEKTLFCDLGVWKKVFHGKEALHRVGDIYMIKMRPCSKSSVSTVGRVGLAVDDVTPVICKSQKGADPAPKPADRISA